MAGVYQYSARLSRWVSVDQLTQRGNVAIVRGGERVPDDVALLGVELGRFDHRATVTADDGLDMASQRVPRREPVDPPSGALRVPKTTEFGPMPQQFLGLTLELIETGRGGRDRTDTRTSFRNSPEVRQQAERRSSLGCPKTGGLSPWRTIAPCRARATLACAGLQNQARRQPLDGGRGD